MQLTKRVHNDKTNSVQDMFWLPVQLMYRHCEPGAVIKWKYHVLLTRIQIENHFNLLTSVCINAREYAAYVTNPLSDCAKKSQYVSAFVFEFHLIHMKHQIVLLQDKIWSL